MPGKKAHHPREPKKGVQAASSAPGKARKSSGQTEGQFSRDPKGRKGQYGGAGDSPLTKK